MSPDTPILLYISLMSFLMDTPTENYIAFGVLFMWIFLREKDEWFL